MDPLKPFPRGWQAFLAETLTEHEAPAQLRTQKLKADSIAAHMACET